MFRAHQPASGARPPAANAGTTAAPLLRRKADGRPKRSRSPCEDEVRFKELLQLKTEMQRRTRQQLIVLSGLEANILDFYYTHTICYEPLMQLFDSTTAVKDGRDASSTAKAAPLSSGLLAVFPELQGSSASAPSSNGAVSPSIPTKTRYYYDSALMRLYREVALQERDLAQHYTAEEAVVRTTEAQVQREIVDGVLAAQLRTEQNAREALGKLETTLAQLQSQCSTHASAIQAAESRIAAAEEAMAACQKRKAVLEAKKQEQMDNAEKISDEVAAFRRTVEAAAADVEKRTAINKSLEEEIARRRAFLRRKRKE